MGRGSRVALLAVAAYTAVAIKADGLDVLQVVSVDGVLRSPPRVVAAASFGGALQNAAHAPGDAAALRLVLAQISEDCNRIELSSNVQLRAASAVLLGRGGSCSFVQKAAAVQHAGASLLVVGDTVQGAYMSGTQTGQPVYDCALGRALVSHNATSPITFPAVQVEEDGLTTCTQSSACDSTACVYTGMTGHGGKGFQVCCFVNTLVRMGVDAHSRTLASTITIPAVFVALRDAEQLRRLVGAAADSSVAVQVFSIYESPWNVSMLLTWLLGVIVVIGGAYCSATDERRFSYEKVAQGLVPHWADSALSETQYISIDDNEQRPQRATAARDWDDESRDHDDRLELSPIHALYFVVGSSSVLVLLYYGHLALLINILFMVATTASMVQVVILPVLTSLPPLRRLAHTQKLYWILPLASLLLAAAISVYWFLHRFNASIWPLQDLLCVSLCFVVIDSIQLPSLKVATILLSAAFAYDVFFVYISPLVFGSSVMIDVASGNSDHMQAAANTQGTHEKLPMVLTVPLLFSYYGGDALLGLGDLILPGLLVSFCIRYDYCMAYPLSRNYFMVAATSYAVGLLLANVMAIALRDVVQGQPALMYIVPIMLSSVALLASRKHELGELWRGPECLRMEHSLALGLTTETSPRRDEVEPFLKKR